MARIAGVNIPENKHLEIALTHIYGIGKKTAQDICTSVKLDYSKKVSDLSEDQVETIRTAVAEYTVEGDLRLSPHQKPEIVAPGERIISTGGQNLWYSSSGTSDSTVFVAGALALILEANPHLKPQPGGDASCLIDVKQALMQSALSKGPPGHDDYYGYGSLDAKGWMEQSRLISDC